MNNTAFHDNPFLGYWFIGSLATNQLMKMFHFIVPNIKNMNISVELAMKQVPSAADMLYILLPVIVYKTLLFC
jgi:hypothetical protein